MEYSIPDSPKPPLFSKLSSVFNRSKSEFCSEDMNDSTKNECLEVGVEQSSKNWLSYRGNTERNDEVSYSTIPQWIDMLEQSHYLQNQVSKKKSCDCDKNSIIEYSKHIDFDNSSMNRNFQNSDLNMNTRTTTSKRPRHFFCFSCNQFKPRSTKARFKVCKHVSCYHCLRKALHVEYWAAKNDIWEKCRAECPFCHIVLDWSKMKPYIVLSLEAKQFPLMLLYDAEERQGEAFNVIHSFFPRGVPSYVIYGNGIDFSVKPKVTQILFGYYLELLNNIESYDKFFQPNILDVEGKDSLFDSMMFSNSKTFSQCSTNSRRDSNSDNITEEEDITETEEEDYWSKNYDIYPDLFNSWRRNILYSGIEHIDSSINTNIEKSISSF